MRLILISAILTAVITGAAIADESILGSRIGNTAIATDASGAITKLYYNADHTFRATAGTMTIKGTWKVDGNNVCLTYDNPPPTVKGPVCQPVQPHNVGDTWTTAEGAAKRTVTLVKGVQ